ncbi:MAG: hypothetical protein KDD47_26345 [Acidobacteria bacterium]|nr:hypothetical protein [Acidobacteriota bacterium]
MANERRVGVVSVTNFPEAPSLGKLAFLNRLPFELRSTVRLVPMDPSRARRKLAGPGGMRSLWQLCGVRFGRMLAGEKAAGRQGVETAFGSSMVAQVDRAVEVVQEEETSLSALSWTLTVARESAAERDKDVQLLLGELRRQGFTADAESYGALEAWLGALPGHGVPNLRRPLVHHPAAARLLLLTSVWTGHETHPHPQLEAPHVVARTAEGSNPFFLCLGERDVGHSLVVGPTGAGKSTALGLLVAQWFRYRGAQAFLLDKGRSLEPLTHAAGGNHYRLAAGGGTCTLGPFEGVEGEERQAHLAGWLEEMLLLQGMEVGPAERVALGEALRSFAASKARKTLAGFRTKLTAVAPRLGEALAVYTEGGAWGHLLSGETNPLREGQLHCFEMGDLLSQPDSIKVPVILHLLHEIEARFDGSPTLLVIEEAVRYLADTLWASRIEDWLLQLRKKNVAVVLVSQMLSAFIRSGIGDALQQSCPTKVFLPNAEAVREGVAEDYRRYGLNEVQIELLARAAPAREYLVVSGGKSSLINFDLDPADLAVLGAGNPEGLARLNGFRAEGGAWLDSYMAALGHEEFLQQLTKKEIA